ncbi:MAG: alpha/beta hydrolase [Clostridia bacterium]|nr:alpha/beta hydrolase [Clostridia bacterium]
MKRFDMTMKDGKILSVCLWEPQGEPRGIVQISHGMAEHIMRYDHIANYLSEHGFVVIGDDHRAHGETDKDTLGFAEGNIFDLTLSDMAEITEYAKKEYRGLKVVLFGHSYGSFLTQAYIEKHEDLIDGAIIGGSAKMTGIVTAFGRMVANIGYAFKGGRAKGEFIKKASFDSYEKKLKDGSFISSIPAETERYLADKYCAFTCSYGFYKYMFKAFTWMYKKENLSNIDKDKPLLLISGDQDPVGEYTKSVEALYNTYVGIGLKNVTKKYYKNVRHEYLNDVSREEAFADILAFVEKVCG